MKTGKPSSLYAVMMRFSSENSTREYVEESCWHEEKVCPCCGQTDGQYTLTCDDRKGYVNVWLLILFVLSASFVEASTYNPFIYFKF